MPPRPCPQARDRTRASGQAKTFTEYDRYGLPIVTYEMEAEKYIYRVYKYEL